MSKEYITIQGDTYDIISKNFYGSEQFAYRIRISNPGILEPVNDDGVQPFNPGTKIFIPGFIPDNIKITNETIDSPSDSDDVVLFINDKRFSFWTKVEVEQSVDGFAIVKFDAPFEPDNTIFRETFRPFAYSPIRVEIGGNLYFTGTMVAINPDLSNSGRKIDVQGYSLPGVLQDCTAPATQAPLEFSDQSLSQIALVMCQPFGIKVEFEGASGEAIVESKGGGFLSFETVSCKPSVKVFDFLSGLAREQNLIMTSTAEGALRFHKSADPGNPRAVMAQGNSPLLSVRPNFSAQSYYSHITGLQPPLFNFLQGESYTVINKSLSNVLRPLVYSVKDIGEGTLKTAVETKSGRMIANSVSYSIELSTWRDANGRLWKPNTSIKLLAPGAMIYNSYEFIIRKVKLSRTDNKSKASLELIIPGSLAGKLPEVLPWD